MLMADLYTSGVIVRAKRSIPALVGLLGLAFFFGGYPFGSVEGTLYQFVTLPGSLEINHSMVFTTIAATIAVFTVLWSAQIGATLGNKRISILGKYTFSLYLVHLAVLYTFTTGIFVVLQGYIGYNKAAILSMVLSIPLVWLVTVLFEKYVDNPSIKFASRISAVYFGEEKVNYGAWRTWILVQWRRTTKKIKYVFSRKLPSAQLEDVEIV